MRGGLGWARRWPCGVALLAMAPAAIAAPARPGDEPALVAAGAGPRAHRSIAWIRPAGAANIAPAELADWTAMWDADTDVPLRLWGRGEPAPGTTAATTASAALADAAAWRFVAAHLAILAPGAAPSDFALVSDQLDPVTRVRSVGFAQRAGGLRVIGGAIGVAFAHDRLVMISSTALPDVRVTAPATRLARATLEQRAVAWLGDAHRAAAASPASGGERVILPIIRPRRPGSAPEIQYRVAEQLAVEATTGPGRWDVWIDATTGAPIARASKLHYASGAILFDVPVRHAGGARGPQPALATHVIDGVSTTAAADGRVTWAGNAAATVALGLSGPRVAITNHVTADATPFAETLSLAPGGSLIWSHPQDEMIDAQLDAFVFANQAKAFAKTYLAPELDYLDDVISVTVNEPDTCNAYSTGDDLHFFRSSAQCANTGRLADVVYHELGHSLHFHSIIPGIGAFDGSLSEGLADTLAVSITGDHGMGRGFHYTDDPLRELAPAVKKRWPDDATGEPHAEGEIIGEALWDLRVALQASLGVEAGTARTLRIYHALLQRASDIPSTYAEALLADDDDGDLSNGTPNLCAIVGAFAAHGLANNGALLAPPTIADRQVSLSVGSSSVAGCTGAAVTGATLRWSQRDAPTVGGAIAMAAGDGTYHAELPAQPDGTVVRYTVQVTWADGTHTTFPHNPADPQYETYLGPVTTLWCEHFETGAPGWTTSATPAAGNDWEIATPAGLGGDPHAAYAGDHALGTDLTSDGTYEPDATSYAESPAIELAGHDHVRLQYRRWLAVEDGYYDTARILANGTEVWRNFRSLTMPMTSATSIDHRDLEWRFQDIDLSSQAQAAGGAGTLQLRFELASDPGKQLGGWTVDDVCLVAPASPVAAPPAAGHDGGCDTTGVPVTDWLVPCSGIAWLVCRRRRRWRPAIS